MGRVVREVSPEMNGSTRSSGFVLSLSLHFFIPSGTCLTRLIAQNRSGIILRSSFILKNDQWLNLAEGQTESQVVKGVVNYRRVPETLLYGLSQPTEEGIRCVHPLLLFLYLQFGRLTTSTSRRVLEHIKSDIKPTATIVVINVREEPLVYVSSTPYVLRSQAVSLRNPKIYSSVPFKLSFPSLLTPTDAPLPTAVSPPPASSSSKAVSNPTSSPSFAPSKVASSSLPKPRTARSFPRGSTSRTKGRSRLCGR